MLVIKNLSKTYKGGKKAVKNLSLEVKEKDIFGFIGPNGAGKTTTIKAICGLIDFDEGEILIDGLSIKDNELEYKKIFAYVPDNPDLYSYLTGIQYLEFICDIFKLDKITRKERIKKYGDLFEITSSLGDLISTLSHGMKQKVALIAALIHEPKLLILDEPFVGLDPKAVIVLKEIMHEMCKNNKAIFFSTHVLDVAEKLCNKICIIKNGELVMVGNTKELTEKMSLEERFMEVLNERVD